MADRGAGGMEPGEMTGGAPLKGDVCAGPWLGAASARRGASRNDRLSGPEDRRFRSRPTGPDYGHSAISCGNQRLVRYAGERNRDRAPGVAEKIAGPLFETGDYRSHYPRADPERL